MANQIIRTPPKYEILGRDIRVTRPSENGQGTHIIWYPRKADERVPYPQYSNRAEQSIETESTSVPLAIACGYNYSSENFSRYSSISVHASEMAGVLPIRTTQVSSAERRKTGRVILTPSFSTEEFSNSAIYEDLPQDVFAGELTSNMLVPATDVEGRSDYAHTIRPEPHVNARPRTPFSNPRAMALAISPSRTFSQDCVQNAANPEVLADNNSERPRALTPYYISPSQASDGVRGIRRSSEVNNDKTLVKVLDRNISRANSPYFVPHNSPEDLDKEEHMVAYVEAQVLSPRSARRATLRSAKKKN